MMSSSVHHSSVLAYVVEVRPLKPKARFSWSGNEGIHSVSDRSTAPVVNYWDIMVCISVELVDLVKLDS